MGRTKVKTSIIYSNNILIYTLWWATFAMASKYPHLVVCTPLCSSRLHCTWLGYVTNRIHMTWWNGISKISFYPGCCLVQVFSCSDQHGAEGSCVVNGPIWRGLYTKNGSPCPPTWVTLKAHLPVLVKSPDDCSLNSTAWVTLREKTTQLSHSDSWLSNDMRQWKSVALNCWVLDNLWHSHR